MNTSRISRSISSQSRSAHFAFTALLFLGFVSLSTALDAAFPAELELGKLNGQTGITILADVGARFGVSVGAVEDVNGDGLSDLLIGSQSSTRNYVIFGGLERPEPTLNITDIDGTNGISIQGSPASSLSGVRDFNEDGLGDVLLGYTAGLLISPGRAFLIFGSDAGLPHPFDLSKLNGVNGVEFRASGYQHVGDGVSWAGDFNGDGASDIVIGAPAAHIDDFNTGAAYLLFGGGNRSPHPFDLSSVDGENGIIVLGESGDRLGASVAYAGDFNGDGLDDVLFADDIGGRKYLLYGSKDPIPNPFLVTDLNGSNGFIIEGRSTNSVGMGSAGDFNDDGIDDLIIGDHGNAYIVFGTRNEMPNPLTLASFSEKFGIKIASESGHGSFGSAVSAAGDMNHDGIGDVVIGESGWTTDSKGKSYVIFGSRRNFAFPFSVAVLDGNNGFVALGEEEGERSGSAISHAGDFNQDGIDDIVIGAPSPFVSNGDKAYVVFGRPGHRLFEDRFER